jgi:hypothetical protein
MRDLNVLIIANIQLSFAASLLLAPGYDALRGRNGNKGGSNCVPHEEKIVPSCIPFTLFCILLQFVCISHRVFQKELHSGISNIIMWRVLNLKAYKPSIFQGVEHCIFRTPLNTNIFVTLATQ